MALDPSEAAGIPNKLIALYSDAELALLTAMTQAIISGIDSLEWEVMQPQEMLRFRRLAESIAAQLQAQMPSMVTDAIVEAAARGRAAADADLADVPTALPKPPGLYHPAPQTRQAAQQAWLTLTQFTQQIPGNAVGLYGQVITQVRMRSANTPRVKQSAGELFGNQMAPGERLEAVQKSLDQLTKRGITGFRDGRGRNWSLSSYAEMKSRTVVNQTLIDSHTDRMVERGQDLIVVSSHRNPAPQCQPFEGQVLSLGGESGTVIRPSAVGGHAVKIHIEATLEQARAAGFQHPNCGHAVSAFVPGASRTFKTEPNPESYAATQKQRAIEREIRDTKRRIAVSATAEAKRQNTARLRELQTQMREHVAAHDLKRRPKRESITAEHRFGRPGTPGNPTPESPRGPIKPPPAPPRTGGGAGGGDEPPRRHIMFGRRITHTELGNLGADKINPPSYRLLDDSGLIATTANPAVYHDEKERSTSDWLANRGVTTRSVLRRKGEGEKTPDSVLDAEDATLELKMMEAASSNSVRNNIRNARKQSRRVVVDGRRVGVDPAVAEEGLREALRKYGSQLDEVLIIYGNGTGDAISWANG